MVFHAGREVAVAGATRARRLENIAAAFRRHDPSLTIEHARLCAAHALDCLERAEGGDAYHAPDAA